jgi:dihydroorotase
VPYDLLIKGGHVLDPGQGLDGRLDIGVTGGRIAAIQADIPAAEGKRVLQIKGDNRYVTPGLIDIHTHVAYGATTPGVGMGCCDPDQVGVRAGVTTVLDCGSVGVANIGVLQTHVMPHAKTRILPFVNVGSYAHTMPGLADVNSLDEVDRKAIAGCIEANPGFPQRLQAAHGRPRGPEPERGAGQALQGDFARAQAAADGPHRRPPRRLRAGA